MNVGGEFYSFPLNENLPVYTLLKFAKYNRFGPKSAVGEERTATIRLPLPVNVPENYGIKTGNQTDLGMIGNVNESNLGKFMAAGKESGWNMDTMMKEGQSIISDNIKSRDFSAANVIRDLGLTIGTEGTKGLTSIATGTIINPHTTVLFEGVNLRTISLEWRLAPRSEDETRAIRNIFNTIKLKSHPDEVGGGYALNYPDLIYVEFMGKVKDYFPVYDRAFVNNINITPDSSGGVNLFKSGAPTSYTLQLTFTELDALTRKRIEEQIKGNS